MSITHDTPFLYRFKSTKELDGSLRVYGPRPFAFVLRAYGDNPECEARPKTSDDHGWMPVSEWETLYERPAASPATERQRARLQNLSVAPPAELTEDAARGLIREAESKLPPTSGLLKKAKAAGVTVADDDTRESLKQKLDQADLANEVNRLEKMGAQVPEGASWQELEGIEERLELERTLRRQGFTVSPGLTTGELADLEHLRDDLREAAKAAKPARIRYRFEDGTELDDAQRRLDALYATHEFWEEFHWQCDGRRGSPKVADVKAAAHRVFEAVAKGRRTPDDARAWAASQFRSEQRGCLATVLALLAAAGSVAVLVLWLLSSA